MVNRKIYINENKTNSYSKSRYSKTEFSSIRKIWFYSVTKRKVETNPISPSSKSTISPTALHDFRYVQIGDDRKSALSPLEAINFTVVNTPGPETHPPVIWMDIEDAMPRPLQILSLDSLPVRINWPEGDILPAVIIPDLSKSPDGPCVEISHSPVTDDAVDVALKIIGPSCWSPLGQEIIPVPLPVSATDEDWALTSDEGLSIGKENKINIIIIFGKLTLLNIPSFLLLSDIKILFRLGVNLWKIKNIQ